LPQHLLTASRSLYSAVETKLLSLPRSITLDQLRNKCGGAATLRYRVPGECGAESLALLSSEDDLAAMVEEADALALQGDARLHLYCGELSRSYSPPLQPLCASPPSPRSVLRSWRSTVSPTSPSLPSTLSEQPPSESMLLLAEAVVASVLDGPDGGPEEDNSSAHALGANGAHRFLWTPPPTPVRQDGPTSTPSPPLSSVPKISSDDMELGPRLGDGTYAVVHAGWWRGAAVAIKILRSAVPGCPASARAAAAFTREAELLSKLQHPNVRSLYGVVEPAQPGVPPAAVLELMPHGSLTACLRSAPPLPLRLQARLALGAARAVEHLHAQTPAPIVHFDLKADNLLVDWRDPNAPLCKLSDLGLACPLSPALQRGAAQGRGTLWWLAPELFPPFHLHSLGGCGESVGTAVDVFSFGGVLFEIATGGSDLYPIGTPNEVVMAAVLAGARPQLPAGVHVDPRWAALMTACWAQLPSERPSMHQVVAELALLSA